MKNSLYRRVIILILIVMPVMIFADDDDPINAGKAAFDKGDYAGAIKLFKEAIKENKQDPQGYIWLGATYLAADSLDNAVAALVQAREMDPENPKVYELLGDVYVAQRVPVAGIEQYRRVLELYKGNISVWLKIAETSRKARKYNDAAEAYINVLRNDTTNLTALRELAVIYMRAKQYANALPLFRELVRLEPDSLIYKINYVKTLYENKYYSELIPIAEVVVEEDPSQTDAQNYLAEAYVVTGRHAQADSAFRKLNPDSLTAKDFISWGKVLRQLKNYDEAITTYERAFNMDSTLTDIYYELGTLYMNNKRYGEAVTMFEKKIDVDSTAGYRFASYLNAAMSLMQIKEYKKAKDYILESIKYRPDNIKAWMTLAQCNALLNNVEDQSTAYQKVIELITIADTSNGDKGKYNKELDEAYRMEGYRLYGEKKYTESLSYLNKALQFNPKNCTILLLMATAWHNNTKEPDEKRYAEAKKYYCRIIQYCPNSEEAKKATTNLKLIGEDCQ